MPPIAAPDESPAAEVGTIHEVLHAIGDPVRLEAVRRLDQAPEHMLPCSATYDGVSKSTASHHFKILREAGLTERRYVDGQLHLRLRSDDVDGRYPGLLGAVLAAASDTDQS